MKPICFIAARGGSKGVKRKNIRLLNKKPLIAYTIEAALKSKIFSHVVVSTEDNEIAKIALKYGATIPFKRPKNLAVDSSSAADALLHGVKKLSSLGYKFDSIVMWDCTCPFLQKEDIVGALKILKFKKPDAVFGVYNQHHNPYFNLMEKSKMGFLHFSKNAGIQIKSRQDAPIVYQLIGLFVIDVKTFLKNQSIYTKKVLPYEIPIHRGLMIDTEFEFELAELLLKNNKILKRFK